MKLSGNISLNLEILKLLGKKVKPSDIYLSPSLKLLHIVKFLYYIHNENTCDSHIEEKFWMFICFNQFGEGVEL